MRRLVLIGTTVLLLAGCAGHATAKAPAPAVATRVHPPASPASAPTFTTVTAIDQHRALLLEFAATLPSDIHRTGDIEVGPPPQFGCHAGRHSADAQMTYEPPTHGLSGRQIYTSARRFFAAHGWSAAPSRSYQDPDDLQLDLPSTRGTLIITAGTGHGDYDGKVILDLFDTCLPGPVIPSTSFD